MQFVVKEVIYLKGDGLIIEGFHLSEEKEARRILRRSAVER